MLSLSDNNQADAVEVFTSTSRYLDDLLILIILILNNGKSDKPNRTPVK